MTRARPGSLRVVNVHERTLRANLDRVAALVDSLGSSDDALWPAATWPRLRLDRPLSVGATGGHGPIRYAVDSYRRGQSLRFRFIAPSGFHGYHGFEVLTLDQHRVLLRHTLEMMAAGPALVFWPLIYRPLHDALIEDALAQAQAALGLVPEVRRWSPRVRFLRWIVSRGKARHQVLPGSALSS